MKLTCVCACFLTLAWICLADNSNIKYNKRQEQFPKSVEPSTIKPRSLRKPKGFNIKQHVKKEKKLFPSESRLHYGFVMPKDQLLAQPGNDRVYYASAPYSVFHTQINVQSQDSEYNAGKVKTQGNTTIVVGSTQDASQNAENNIDNESYLSPPAYNPYARPIFADDTDVSSRIFRTTDTMNEEEAPFNAFVYEVAPNNRQRTYMDWLMTQPETAASFNNEIIAQAKSFHEDSNIQGINIINSDFDNAPVPSFGQLFSSEDSNIQGVNVLHSNILGFAPHLHNILQYNGLGKPFNSDPRNSAIEKEELEASDATSNVEKIDIQATDLQEDGYHYQKPAVAFYY